MPENTNVKSNAEIQEALGQLRHNTIDLSLRSMSVAPSTRRSGSGMLVDEFYVSLSAAITRNTIGHKTRNWENYFDGLRNLTIRVVARTDERVLTAAEKAELTKRLIDRIDELANDGLRSNGAKLSFSIRRN